jgi:hypothetical protein
LGFFWKCINPVFKFLAAVYAILAFTTWIRDELFPSGWGRYHILTLLRFLPAWPAYLWVAIGVLIVGLALIEGAFRDRRLQAKSIAQQVPLLDAEGNLYKGLVKASTGKIRWLLPGLVALGIAIVWYISTGPKVTTLPLPGNASGNKPGERSNQDGFDVDRIEKGPLTLQKLFFTENNNALAIVKSLLISSPGRGEIEIKVAADFDFDAKAKFLTVYIPSSESMSMLTSKYICSEYLDVFRLVEQSVIPSRMHGNDPFSKVSADEMVFTGRVFIYHEDEFSVEQIYSLTHTCSNHGASLQLKGPAYLSEQRLIQERHH